MNPEDSKILVVDDNEVNRDMLSRRLKRRGFDVDTAANGKEALKLVDAGNFDLILLDIMMPILNGLEVLKILRQTYPANELPIIMATAKDRSEDVVEALELGANDYVTKPIDFPVVLARVQSHLRQKVSSSPKGPQVETTPQEIGPGTVLAEKYQLEELLGKGNFGAVFKAIHLNLQQSVAIKILQTSMAPASEALARFQREGISACRVQHPNAVSVIDFGITSTGTAYLVMELLNGRSLAEELSEKPILHPIRCAQILRPICEALTAAHRAGVVHRDIKPANIFLHQSRTGEIVKVLDFGIAKFVGDVAGEEHLTVEGSILGTPTYMAPERFSNEAFDGRADVYSLGILLYRMLTGNTPFRSKDLMAVAMQHMREQAPPIAQFNPQVTPEIEAVVMKAMSKKMQDRPSTVELAKLFGQALGRRESDRRLSVPRAPAPAPAISPAAKSEVPVESAPPKETVIPPTQEMFLPDFAGAHPDADKRPVSATAQRPRQSEEDSKASSMRRLFDKLFDGEG